MSIAGTLLGFSLVALAAGAPMPAPAPAPGTPGTYTFMQDNYTIRVSPSIKTTDVDAFAAYSFAGGSLQSAGTTEVDGSSMGLEVSYSTNPPAAVNVTSLRPRGSYTFDAFGGAACVTFTFTSNASSTILTLNDADALFDINYTRSAMTIDYGTCSALNCTSSRTIPLNASSGHYYFNASNPSSSYTWAALTFQLYPAGASACQNAMASVRVPTPYVETTPSLIVPALQTTGIIVSDTLSSRGQAGILATIRNTSCVNASLSIFVASASGRLPTPATLVLIDEQGLEDVYNPASENLNQAVPGSLCSAGLTNSSCNFSANKLNPSYLYHMLLVYRGNSSAPLLPVGLFLNTFTTSGGACPSSASLSSAVAALPSAAASSPASTPSGTPSSPRTLSNIPAAAPVTTPSFSLPSLGSLSGSSSSSGTSSSSASAATG